MAELFADIALPLPLPKPFTYIVPRDLADAAVIGSCVLVPFGTKLLTGVVVARATTSDIRRLKAIADVLDAEPSFTDELLRLTKWVAEYYLASWGEVLKTAAPLSMVLESKLLIRLLPPDPTPLLEKARRAAPLQQKVLQALALRTEMSLAALKKTTGIRHLHAVLNTLERNGVIETVQSLSSSGPRTKTERTAALTATGISVLSSGEDTRRVVRLTPRQEETLKRLGVIASRTPSPIPVAHLLRSGELSLPILKALSAKHLVVLESREVVRTPDDGAQEPPPAITLNTHQAEALRQINAAVDGGAYIAFLLRGITGSGKTQVYIESLLHARSKGKTGIVLVPEISLTPQIVRRFRSHFGDRVAVTHSQMSAGERRDAWRMARDGKVDVIIGPRSAVFAPLPRIGLIIVDEEHEASYKQYDAVPRYHARDVAIVRTSLSGSVVVLGSATPSAESYQNAVTGKYHLLELPHRIDSARLPAVTIVDMAAERRRERAERAASKERRGGTGELPMISVQLRRAIQLRIARREGVILLQNRRGFSHVVECFDCGYVEKCDHCDVTLTYHSTKRHLRCHYCGFVKAPPSLCPSCGGLDIRFHAFGTQRIEDDLKRLFPQAGILRMDLDTTARKGALQRILRDFADQKADILLGTQMVAKGLDFPHVTLVGVISADTQMLLPDFRSSERTFQLLTQVAGRAGRSMMEGEVIIQTLQPEHYSLRHAQTHNVTAFFAEELQYRRELLYPPFSRLVLIEFRGEREQDVLEGARKWAGSLLAQHQSSSYTVLGPAEAAIPRLRRLFRRHLIIKASKDLDPSGQQVRTAIHAVQRSFEETWTALSRRIQIVIDVDPQSLM